MSFQNLHAEEAAENRVGLPEAVRRLKGIEEIRICRFTAQDVVRHSLVEKIINAYRAPCGDGEEEAKQP